jgi:hypothetical protein
VTFVSSSLFCYLGADRFFLTVPRPEEILRDFEPSNQCRRHLRPWTLFSLSDTKIPHSQYLYALCDIFFRRRWVSKRTCCYVARVWIPFTVSIRQLRAQTSGATSAVQLGVVATGRWGQLTYGYGGQGFLLTPPPLWSIVMFQDQQFANAFYPSFKEYRCSNSELVLDS